MVQDERFELTTNLGSQPSALSIELILYICSFLAIQAVFQAYGNPLIHHDYVAYFDSCKPWQWLYMNCLDSAYFIAWQMLKDLNLSFFHVAFWRDPSTLHRFRARKVTVGIYLHITVFTSVLLTLLTHLGEHLGIPEWIRTTDRLLRRQLLLSY